MLTFGSLFSGIGGIDLGLERAGMRCAWQVENDDYATRVLAKHWPDVPRFGDVRTVGGHNLSPVDLIAGGFPCQGVSNAGQRLGLADPRSGLWSEFARIIGELRPRYVLVENVAALLGRGMGTVLGDLSTLGYDAEWEIVSAAAVGAPHFRERVFIVAYARSERSGENARGASGDESPNERWAAQNDNQPQCDGQGGEPGTMADSHSPRPSHVGESQAGKERDFRRDAIGGSSRTGVGHRADAHIPRLEVGQSVFRDAREKLAAFERSCSTGSGVWATEPDVGRMADGVPARVDRLRGLGNAVVPQVAEYIGRLLLDA